MSKQRADSTSKPPWSHLPKRQLEMLDHSAQIIAEGLSTSEMYYIARRLTQHADDIENGEE